MVVGRGKSEGGSKSTQRPSVLGRSSRKDQKNPFAGYKKQSYDEIVKECKKSGRKFEDPEFEASNTSIYFSKEPPKPFEWKRPGVSIFISK